MAANVLANFLSSFGLSESTFHDCVSIVSLVSVVTIFFLAYQQKAVSKYQVNSTHPFNFSNPCSKNTEAAGKRGLRKAQEPERRCLTSLLCNSTWAEFAYLNATGNNKLIILVFLGQLLSNKGCHVVKISQ